MSGQESMRGFGLKVNRLLLVACALAGIGIVGGMVMGHKAAPSDESVSMPISKLAPERSASAADQSVGEPSSAASASATGRARYAPIADGMATKDTYAFLSELRRSKDRGALASVTLILNACRAGMGALSSYREPGFPDHVKANLARTAGSLELGEAQQLRYAQLMAARCGDVANDDGLEIPVDGDESGAKFRDAQSRWFDQKTQFSAFYDMAEQGHLVAAHEGLMTWPFFEEKRYSRGEDRKMLMAAIEVAAYRATSDPSQKDADLRLMALCLAKGLCDGRIESYWFASWPEGSEKRQQAMALADRITRAFERNDLRAFLPKLPADIKLPDSFARF